MKFFFALNTTIFISLLLLCFNASAQIVEPNMPDSSKKVPPKAIGTGTPQKGVVKIDSTTSYESGDRAQTAFLEIGGPGLALTVNYDARFGDRRDGFGYRVGAGYFATDGNNVFSVPLQLNYLFGNTSHLIEVGAGTTFLNSHGNSNGKVFIFDRITGFIGTGTVGYRYQPQEKGINLRIGFVPIFCDEGVIAAGGVSVGYTFK